MDTIKIWYIDEKGNQLGEGDSFTEVEGTVSIPPNTPTDIWDGEQWVTPAIPSPPEPTEEELKLERMNTLKGYLADTDYKDLPNYKPKLGGDLSKVIEQRNAWRDEVRQLEVELGVTNGSV